MKFQFENIGPITSAEMELGAFTIIAGRNNTGKTYLVYTLYGFLKEWKEWVEPMGLRRRSERFLPENFSALTVDTRKISRNLRESGQYTCSADCVSMNRDRQAMISRVARNFSIQIANIFSSPHGNFAKASIRVDFGDDDTNIPNSDSSKYLRGAILIKYNDGKLTFSADKFAEKHVPLSRIEHYVLFGYMLFLLADLPSPFIISAERFGISLFYKELDFTKNRLVEMLQNMGDEKHKGDFSPFMFIERSASRYALPIKDNIDYTRDIARFVKQKSELHGSKLHESIKKIMDGYYKSDENEIRFISRKRKEGRFEIPLHLASSSARGLSDLYFYLLHVVAKNELLIIDEPESHLDTKNQIMLARMLANFVQNGIKVLITTHSDYVLKEINNLVMLSNSFDGKEEFIREHKYGKDEFLLPGKLRCYVAENGKLTPCKIDKLGVDMPIFDRTIDDINKVSNNLVARLEYDEEK